ncbi:DEAD/DEAH box helicase [Peptostreptococcus anaerobius]|uniref:DEAD/DEAH box helicase n=1 Tax=Peptostreptococcus anaerobius TaxID=1261 RepID=UPI003D6F50B0
MNFKDFNIDENLVQALAKIGIKEPTRVQLESIPLIIDKRDLMIKSNTGTGKTLSFLLPLIDKILKKDIDSILILAPTRELVLQINDMAVDIISHIGDENIKNTVNILPIYGGKDIKAQINKLKNSINILVATPGRLLDHINRNTISVSKFDSIVIDEADQMLLMGFRNEIDLIFSKIKKYDQTIFLSATLDSKVKKLVYRYSNKPIEVNIEEDTHVPDLIEQEFVFTNDRQKFEDFCSKIDHDQPFMAIVFCRTKARVDNLEEKLGQRKYNCKKIHSDISQAKRERIMKDFRDLKIQFLISTDLSARGIDVNGISHIYNYDFPERPEDYIHRIGRAGRIGKDGKSCSFVTEKNMSVYDEVKAILEK